MKNDRFLEGQIEDKIKFASDRYIVTYTGFLDPHAHALAKTLAKGASPDITVKFWGGYDDAERTIMLCLPDYADIETANPLSVIRVSVKEGGRKLTHGDYLGSLLGLGINRDKVGDILVRDDGADIIILNEISEFVMTHYAKAGRTSLSLEEKTTKDLIIEAKERKICIDTVASLRLDNIVSSAFGLSRAKAADAIKAGRVFVDSIEILKPDFAISEGTKVNLRGSGKIVLTEIGGKSRKDRIYITYEKY